MIGGGGIVPKHKICGIDFGPGGKLLRKPGKDGVLCYLVKKKQNSPHALWENRECIK